MLENKTYIEFAKHSDVSEISKISVEKIEYGLMRSYTPKKVLRAINSKTKIVIVARMEQELVGFGIMTYREDQANLDLLAVKEEFRRLKIGTELVLWLEKIALTAGIYNVFVQAREINEGAIAFYEKLGFLKIDFVEGYYQGVENGVIMAKMLMPIVDVTNS